MSPWTLTLSLLLAGASSAQAVSTDALMGAPATPEACHRDANPGMPEGPVGAGYYEADFATGRRACPRSEVGIGAAGGAVIDTPGFYGDVDLAGIVFGSWAVTRTTELFATFEAVRYEYAQDASIAASELGVGQLTVGATQVVYQHGGFTLSPSLRLMLPTSTATGNTRVVGAELGAAFEEQLLGKLSVLGYAGVDGSGGISEAPGQVRIGLLGNVGLEYLPARWFGLVVDVTGHFFSRAGVDYLAPELGLRFAGGPVGVQLGASLPVVGEDRHLAVGHLRVSYRF